ncbi:M28 family peptidase [candidate division KSB1 bacterium]|nr:M28 family peptidase [candidate division KSB1 bacterium]
MQRQLRSHVETLATEIGERNSTHYAALEQAYLYIFSSMQQTSFDISTIEYSHEHRTYQIAVAEKKGTDKPDEIIVVGAHYDTVEDCPGADDNASGIAGLLECMRIIDSYPNSRTIRFVAFPLEEPPFHNSPLMGSHVYARKCHSEQQKLLCMIAFEMLGYYTEKRGTQRYPTSVMEQKLTNRGNFIAIVGNVDSKNIVSSISQSFDEQQLLPVEPLVTYEYVPGSNLSDHAPFWEHGYKAVMVTDTAFYRNPYYHLPEDTPSTLNFNIFAKVIISMAKAIQDLDLIDASAI